MLLRRLAPLLALALAPACTDRSRPSPVEPGIGLSVLLVEPLGGQSFRPGTLFVRIRGHDIAGRLSLLGARLLTSPDEHAVDSAAVRFTERFDTIATVPIRLPQVSKPTAFDLIGVAGNATGGSAETVAAGIAVLPCPATGC